MISNIECRNRITSNDYADFMADNTGNDIDIINYYHSDCFQIIDERNAIVYVPLSEVTRDTVRVLGNAVFPNLYGLLDISSLEASGIDRAQALPSLSLRGQGVIYGIVDTGIDYTNPLFVNEDGTTRILSIWDQSIQGDNYPPEMFYGTEYSREQINEALQNNDPFSVVPSKDENGHGTFLAGVGAGNRDEANNFSGVAPEADLLVVKLKESKPYLREFYVIPDGVPCYQENSIMQGVAYLVNYARNLNKPITICLGLGTTQGGHDERGALSNYLSEVADLVGVNITIAAGNEGNAGLHYFGMIDQDGGSDLVELKVGENEFGFTMQLWGSSPNTYSIDILSPTGEYVPRIPARRGENRDIEFLLEDTVILLNYILIEPKNGDELIFLRFIQPTAGIWRFRVYGRGQLDLQFNIWLPLTTFISDQTFFLNPDPETTVTSPGNADIPLTVTAYDHHNQSLYLAASRGYTRTNMIKPELAAPGVNLITPNLNGTFSPRSGTSLAAAHTAGVAGLLLEWGIVKNNYIFMDTIEVKKFLIRGAIRNQTMIYPNKEWGYGILNIFNVFESLRDELSRPIPPA